MIRLYGTVTSPYVRRVRIVADELGLPCELINTATDEGQAALRARSPIWKVPAAEIDGQLVIDSHAITDVLIERFGRGKLRLIAVDDVEARNAMAVIDAVSDSLINSFYLEKEGAKREQLPYLGKQHARAASAMAWLEQNVHEPFVTSRKEYGLPEIALGTTLDWMRFRNVYPFEQHARLVRCFEAFEKRASSHATRPVG
jgi:glutathione S-transferase